MNEPVPGEVVKVAAAITALAGNQIQTYTYPLV